MTETRARARWLAPAIGAAVVLVALCLASVSVSSAVKDSAERLSAPGAESLSKQQVAVAAQAEVGYCTPRFKEVLQRVLHSCGLTGDSTRRGCKPADVKSFAAISDEDFNELFTPLKERGAVIMFDVAKEELDAAAKKLLEQRWYERGGARYFFVVARASRTGTQAKNRALSHRRANSVMYHLKEVANDPELESKVGLLWLGNEFAQLSGDYCSWQTSRADQKCDEEAINRSAFVSWVDCRL